MRGRAAPLLCALALAGGGSKPPRKLVLLHTNDEHSHLPGFGSTSAAGGNCSQ